MEPRYGEEPQIAQKKRRLFIEGRIDLGGELDCMYIETTRESYGRWHAENQRDYRRRQAEKNMKIVSMEHESQGDEQCSLSGKLSDGIDWEMMAIEDTDMEALQIGERYGVSEQTVSTWKREFETFVLEYLHL